MYKNSSKHYISLCLKNELIIIGLKKGGKETHTYKSLGGKFTKRLCHFCILFGFCNILANQMSELCGHMTFLVCICR